MKNKRNNTASPTMEHQQKQLKRQNSTLERLKCELKVETSLERVRVKAMDMKQPDDLLDICETAYRKLKALGFTELRNAMINIHHDDQGFFLNYDYSDRAGKNVTKIYYDSHPSTQKLVNQVKKSRDAFAAIEIKGRELNKWREYRKSMGETDDSRLDTINTLSYYFYSTGIGAIGTSTYSPISEAKLKVLQRFRNVFDFAYRRYADVTQAEAQAREARIEAALERVRARAMAMQNSSELAELVATVFTELTRLDFSLTSCILWINNPETITNELWVASREINKPAEPYYIKPFRHSFFKSIVHAWKAKDRKWIFELSGKEKKTFEDLFFEDVSSLPEILKSLLRAPEKVVFSASFCSFGALEIVGNEPLPDEMFDILHRFGKVFDLTYTRFNDLKQAEAQAREAQIELALERVRARTMAMQHSDELRDAASLLFQQVKELGIDAWTCGYNIWEEDRKSVKAWLSRGFIQPDFKYPLTENPTLKHFYDAAQRGESLFVEEVSGDVLTELYRYLETLRVSERISDEKRPASPTYQVNHTAYFLYGYLLFVTYKPYPEAHDIFKRFAVVFEQTYTRFLDLEKAEAQVREAKIETALEKVRSRSLAMHKSDELQEVVHTVFEKLNELEVELYTAIIFIFTEGSKDIVWWLENKASQQYSRILVPAGNNHYLNDIYEARENGMDFLSATYSFEEKNDLFHHLFENTDFKYVPVQQKQFLLESELATMSVALAKNTGINITSYTKKAFSEKENEILKRFAKVFDQAYTRFLDLQKAEEQARESQIQLALERVRARTMAMYDSSELSETAQVLFQQFADLGGLPDQIAIGIVDEKMDKVNFWTTDQTGSKISKSFEARLNESTTIVKAYRAWKDQEKFLLVDLQGRELIDWIHFVREEMDLVVKDDFFKDRRVHHIALFSHGWIMVSTHEPQSSETINILERFAGVFNHTFRRFLDLQKAEAQAREAQIETALERIRSRTMAMQKSEELPETSYLLFQQVKGLGYTAVQNSIGIINEDAGFVELSTTVHGHHLPHTLNVPINDPYVIAKAVAAWKAKRKSLNVEIRGQELKDYNERRNGFFETKVYFPEDQWIVNIVFFSKGWLSFSSDKNISGETFDLLKRFAAVFEQTYVRFNDLKQAEAQAREAEIQLALERVRARSLAMHHTSELQDIVDIVAQQLYHIGMDINGGVVITINEEVDEDLPLWASSGAADYVQKVVVPFFDRPIFTDLRNAIKRRNNFFANEYGKEEKDEMFDHLFRYAPWSSSPEERKKELLSREGGLIRSAAISQYTSIAITNHNGKKFSEKEHEILKRFGNVFEQTYTRFLDLQKAEAQAREAKIEVALERTRTQSMLMQHSTELDNTLRVFHEQVLLLGIHSSFSFLWLPDEDKERHIFWAAWAENVPIDPLAKKVSTVFKSKAINYPLDRNEPATAQCLVDWKGKESVVSYQVPPAGVKSYFAAWHELIAGVELLKPEYFSNGLYYVEAFMKYGCFGVMIKDELQEEEKKILGRFAIEFERAYTRFLDLQKAEAQAREAIKRASVDRVRAEIASMRTTNDLERIIPLIWNELITLGVPFIRCGVFIMEDAQRQIQTLLSTPEGKSIATFQMSYEDTEPLPLLLTHWQRNEMYKTHWDEAAFIESIKILMRRGAITSEEQFTSGFRPTNLHLHFLPFLQGMLYVGSEVPLTNDEIQLTQNLADAFSTAYARYEDFNKLETANNKIEKTLVDLKQTQAQLIQSEKMASLGELTAGIAHEIQNPLNFVNNFAEVNAELVDEIKQAVQSGNNEEILALADNVKQNLEKINFHGKRADGIVKSMLQHSRTSDQSSKNKKEPTDINALADEYLRLAYHGLRAKDKAFNATLHTDFDEALGLIEVVSQDIGRAILNLITNAFYAVQEKQYEKETDREEYTPMVSISTKRINNSVEIRVKDNGLGIPQHVLDKIFQPFFTTKPTGQGTGLGLSLCYDIVKAHGGELKVITEMEVGSEFIIILPVV